MFRNLLLLCIVCPWIDWGLAEDLVGRDQSALNSTLWAGTAVEHDAAALQTYHLAKLMLDRALRDRTSTAAIEQQGVAFRVLPPAIIMDIDETILDNSPFEARLLAKGTGYDATMWQDWVAEAKAKPIPGAVDFARYAQARGVTVLYVTNREAAQKPATESNLFNAGFPVRNGVETLYCRGERPSWGSDKTTRRAEIATHYRILLLFGDDLGDFVSGANTSVANRRVLSKPFQENWGVKWFVLPNAMYGSWQTALNDSVASPDEQEMQRLKYEAIRQMLDPSAGAATSKH
jgi:5'-nucleotidase (lipoprotein e(P4) family)